MPDPLIEILRRDRRVVIAALVGISLLAWIYLVWIAANMSMGSHDAPAGGMAGMPDMPGMVMPNIRPWVPGDFVYMFVMWAMMMLGMMTPSAAPMILMYARVCRHAEQSRRPLPSVAWFVAGYLVAWALFSAFATLGQWALTQAALLSPMMKVASSPLGGGILIIAGLYQFTPAKQACLQHCRTPLEFIQRYGGYSQNPYRTLQLGLHHGLYCVGCCWALMLLLFFGGIMNFAWIAGLAVLVLLEKVAPRPRLVSGAAGAALVLLGAAVIVAN